jgi:hypothetical protein
MKDEIQRIATNPGQYTFTGNNCVNFVRRVLREAGIESPSTIKPSEFLEHLDGVTP